MKHSNQASQPLYDLMQRIGYTFKDIKLLDLSLSHRSVGSHNNERLEFLGDSIVNFIIGKILYLKFPQAKEGELSRLTSSLVKGVTLAEIAKEMRIGDTLNLGIGARKSGGHERVSILADALEAIIGAIYLDSDMATCEACILAWFADRITQMDPDADHKDAKTRLQEYLQARKLPLPIYKQQDARGEDHQQVFTISCTVQGLKPSLAEANSRRIGEQKAAALALAKLEKKP